MANEKKKLERIESRLELKAGQKYALCTCGLSATLPLCDGAHKGTDFKSLKIVAGEDVAITTYVKKP